METFFNLDNGGITFKITYYNNIVSVYKKNTQIDHGNLDEIVYETFPCLVFKSLNMLSGKEVSNLHTRFSGGDDIAYTSFLFELHNNVYIYIGPVIYAFKSHNKIKDFISAVGNSSVVYPWAIDSKNIYYLMDYDCVIELENTEILKEYIKKDNDPYIFYYNNKQSGKKIQIEMLVNRN